LNEVIIYISLLDLSKNFMDLLPRAEIFCRLLRFTSRFRQ